MRGGGAKAIQVFQFVSYYFDTFVGGKMCFVWLPVHHHGSAPAVRGRGDGPLHAQDRCGHV